MGRKVDVEDVWVVQLPTMNVSVWNYPVIVCVAVATRLLRVGPHSILTQTLNEILK